MLKMIHKKEMLTLLAGVGTAAFLSIPIFYHVPVWVKFIMVFTAAYVVFLTLRLVWIMFDPVDRSIALKSRAAEAQSRGLCPVCGRNRPGNRTLEIGYRRRVPRALRFDIFDLAFGEGMTDDIHISVPVCENCAKKYLFLSKFRQFASPGLDRSFRVLRRKPGYLRGLKHPFEPTNIRIAK